jgi:hypothetical protein
MQLLPLPLLLSMALPLQRPAGPAEPLAPHLDAIEPDWRNAYQRWRDAGTDADTGTETETETEQAPPEPLPVTEPLPILQAPTPPVPRDTAPVVAEVRSAVPQTPAAERLEALRQLGEPAAAARVWQVELPAAGPAWQLRVEQAQPQAPLNLELRVPPVAQTQARQQLGDLDRRLREAGHDVLRPRLRDGARADRKYRPVDEVEP